jgi:transcriptional regulator with XRE-family HTH domain
MFDTRKFGAYISRLRKNADMTQSELAERLSLTRQAISKYELGDSFPDISILLLISDVFGVSLDELINSGEPSRGEALILGSAAVGNDDIIAQSVSDIVNLAPLLKPSLLAKLAAGLGKQGLDISSVVTLAEYLNDESVIKLLENAEFDKIDEKLLEKLMPFLDEKSKATVFDKIIKGELDWHMIKALLPYADYISSQIEEAVMEGALPWAALKVLRDAQFELGEKRKNE